MTATGPYFWTQTLKWMDPSGVARARWHRLDLANNNPFSSWDAGDGDGPQVWRFQQFNCPGFDSGLVTVCFTKPLTSIILPLSGRERAKPTINGSLISSSSCVRNTLTVMVRYTSPRKSVLSSGL